MNTANKQYGRLTKKGGYTKELDLKQELGYSYIYNRLAELEDKIMGGTLIELPCKVGDTVYSNERIMFEPLTVKVITIHQSKKFSVSYTVIAMAKDGHGIYLSRDNFNEDWFLTKAEAEAQLKELQEEQE